MTTLRGVLEKMESVPPERRHPEVDHGFRGSIPDPYLYLPSQRFADALAGDRA